MSRALRQTRAGSLADATSTIQAVLAGRTDRPEAPMHSAVAPTPLCDTSGVEDAEIVEDHPRTPGAIPSTCSDAGDERSRSRSVPGIAPLARSPSLSWPSRCQDPARDRRCQKGPVGGADVLDAPRRAGLSSLCSGVAAGWGTGAGADASGLHPGSRRLRLRHRHERPRRPARPHRRLPPPEPRPQRAWLLELVRPGDQQAKGGEPAILAELARSLAAEFGVDQGRVFVAGLSAGGAMAAILGATHSDVFAAVGVHSALPRGVAHDVVSAFAAMRGTDGRRVPSGSPAVRTIVFHGDADPTVHVSNAEALVAAAQAGAGQPAMREFGQSKGGRRYVWDSVSRRDGTPLTEFWRIEGAGHAWSGGSAAGSYVDPAGPDASAEMVRFFLSTL